MLTWENLLAYMLDYDFTDCVRSDNIEYVWAFIKTSIYTAMNLKLNVDGLHIHVGLHLIKHHLNCLCTLKRRTAAHPTVHNQSKLNKTSSRQNFIS